MAASDSSLPSPLLSPRCKGNPEENAESLKHSAEREIALEYSKWLQSTAFSPTALKNTGEKRKLERTLWEKETILKRLTEELESLERNAGLQTKLYESQHVSGQNFANLTKIERKTGEIRRENDSYGELIGRIGLTLENAKEKCANLTENMRKIDATLEKLKEKNSAIVSEMQENQWKRERIEAVIRQLRDSRMEILSNRLKTTEKLHENVSKQRENMLEKAVNRLKTTKKSAEMHQKVGKLKERGLQTAAVSEHCREIKSNTMDTKLLFEDCFGTSDPEGVISVFKRAIYRSDMLRKEIEALLSDQNKARLELQGIIRLKNEIFAEEKWAKNRKLLKSQQWTTTKHDNPAALSAQQLIILSTVSLAQIYWKCLHFDPWKELSCEEIGDTKRQLPELMLAIEKKVETAMEISFQSQRIRHILQFSDAKKLRIAKNHQQKSEFSLKVAVYRDHFLSNPTETDRQRRVSGSIESMLSSVASLLVPPTNAALHRPLQDQQHRRKVQKQEDVEEQETGYWETERKAAKRGETAAFVPISGSLSERPSRLALVSPRALASSSRLQKPDYSRLLESLQNAQKKVMSLQTSRPMRPTPSSQSITQSSSKTKDTLPSLKPLPFPCS